MSMHEIEDMVEGAIRVLDLHDEENKTLRDAIHALYKFQHQYDCGFTHGRVFSLLLKHRFTYQFKLNVHPEYSKNSAAFEKAAKAKPTELLFVSSEILHKDNVAGRSTVGNENGYVTAGELCADLNTPLWRTLVKAGKLHGPDAKAAKDIKLLTLTTRVVKAAVAAKDAELVAMWFNLGPQALFGQHFTKSVKKGEVLGTNQLSGKKFIAKKNQEVARPFTAKEAMKLPETKLLKELYQRSGASKVKLAYDHRPPPEYQDAIEKWWFDA
jgi:hypothetical protein